MANWKMKLPKIQKGAGIFLGLLIGFVILGFADKKQESRVCSGIYVRIDNQLGNYFINEQDIVSLITSDGESVVIGRPFRSIDLKGIERQVQENKFVYDAEVYRSLDGQLMVDVVQNKPIARIISDKIKDQYMSKEGEVLPVSKRYTARTLLISGGFADKISVANLNETDFGKELYKMLLFIEGDPFWKAQVAQLDISANGNITMFTQVSKQVVEFGRPVDFEKKLKKLKIFYTSILPGKGWNSYEKVSVKYKDQIICE